MSLKDLCNIIAATVHDMGTTGAPSGVLYSGLLGRCGHSDYQRAVQICVQAGLITLDGSHVLRGTPKLAAIMAKLTANA
jgi:hypothetical protein